MRKILCLCMFSFQISFASIQWIDDYSSAEEEAKKKKQPLCILFTKEGCHWCNKLHEEILSSGDFAKEVQNRFVFCRQYFPYTNRRMSEGLQKKYEIKEKYQITGFPQMLIVDVDKGVISQMGYLPISGKKYGKKLQKVLADYQTISKDFQKVLKTDEKEKVLMHLYKKAKKINCPYFEQVLFEEGKKTAMALHFLMDRYQAIVDAGNKNSEQGQLVRKEIEEQKIQDQKDIRLKLALLDFQDASELSSADEVVLPLVEYIQDFDKKDKDNVWRLRMIVAQYYLSKNELEKALDFARASYKSAPKMVKKEITNTIFTIKQRVQQTSSN